MIANRDVTLTSPRRENLGMSEQRRPPQFRKALDRVRQSRASVSRSVNAKHERFRRVVFSRVAANIVGNERLVALHHRSKSLPSEPFFGNIGHIAEVPSAETWHGKQLVAKRLVRVVERH